MHFIDGLLNAQIYGTRSWVPLLNHTPKNVPSCCSMIIHNSMLWGSGRNSWKLKTSQFLHGQHSQWSCHPLSMFRMLWISSVYDGVFQFLPMSSRSTQLWRGVDKHSTGHNRQSDHFYARMFFTPWAKCGHTRDWPVFCWSVTFQWDFTALGPAYGTPVQ